jgi:hypothetical protein
VIDIFVTLLAYLKYLYLSTILIDFLQYLSVVLTLISYFHPPIERFISILPLFSFNIQIISSFYRFFFDALIFYIRLVILIFIDTVLILLGKVKKFLVFLIINLMSHIIVHSTFI